LQIKKTKKEYLCHTHKTVAIKNKKGELEITPTRNCEAGDAVWVLDINNNFIKTIIY
jgi:hypothetical protein